MSRYLIPDGKIISSELHKSTPPKFRKLNDALGSLVDDYSLVQFIPLNVFDEESVSLVLTHADHSIQYGEDMEPKEPWDEAPVDDVHEMGLAPEGSEKPAEY